MENIISYFSTYTPAADGAIWGKFGIYVLSVFAAIVIFLGRAIVAFMALSGNMRFLCSGLFRIIFHS